MTVKKIRSKSKVISMIQCEVDLSFISYHHRKNGCWFLLLILFKAITYYHRTVTDTWLNVTCNRLFVRLFIENQWC